MAEEIDPKDKAQKEEQNVTVIFDGRDKVQYTLTSQGVAAMGKGTRHKAGEKHWGHPILVKKFAERKWAEIIDGSLIEHKMPEPDKKLKSA